MNKNRLEAFSDNDLQNPLLKYFFLLFFCFSFMCCHHKQRNGAAFANNYLSDTILLHNGDIIFQDLDCGELCDAIEQVTQGINGAKLSHVGIVMIDSLHQTFVIEAYGNVKKTPITAFLNRVKTADGKPKVLVGRLKPVFQTLADKAVQAAQSSVGMPYDDAFLPDNQKYYCSELIYDCFKKANNDSAFFNLQPMTFKDPTTHQYLKTWVDYYYKMNLPIPENVAGINPGVISRSNKIDILKLWGDVSGYVRNNFKHS